MKQTLLTFISIHKSCLNVMSYLELVRLEMRSFHFENKNTSFL